MKKIISLVICIVVLCVLVSACTGDEPVAEEVVAQVSDEIAEEVEESEESRVKEEPIWGIEYYQDEFGDDTTDSYMVANFFGTFSNSATSGSDLLAVIFYDKGMNTFGFRMVEYGSHISSVDDNNDVILKMKIDGDVEECNLYPIPGDQFYCFNDSVNDMLVDTLKAGTDIKCVIEVPDYATTGINYNFVIKGEDFAETYDEAGF